MECFGLTFRGLKLKDVIEIDKDRCKFIITVNADFIVRAHQGDARLRRLINNHVSTFDGFWPWLIAQRRRPDLNVEKISGSDLIYSLADECQRLDRPILIVGGSAVAAATALNNRAGRNHAFGWEAPFENYPMSDAWTAAFRQQVKSILPLVVVVCLGSPKQEFFIDDQLEFMHSLGVRFAYGAGGTADMISGKFKRAPVFLRNIGLEGIWRLISEPSLYRLKRIFHSVKIFRYMK